MAVGRSCESKTGVWGVGKWGDNEGIEGVGGGGLGVVDKRGRFGGGGDVWPVDKRVGLFVT